MKKNCFMLGLLTVALVFGMMVIGCDEEETHGHSYSGGWLSDSTQHWHVCSCGEKGDIANHSFNGSICTICNYNNGSGTVSLSLITRQQLSSYDSKYYYYVMILLNTSNGVKWTSDPGSTITKDWVTLSGLDFSDWTFTAAYETIMPNTITLQYNTPTGQSSPIAIGSGITATINQEKLTEMKGYTNVSGTFTTGTASASSSAWTN